MKFAAILLSLLHLTSALANCDDPNKIDVYFVAGQSNAVGTAKVSEVPSSLQAMVATNKNKLTWNYQTDKLEPLALGVNNNLLHDWNGNFGPEGMFAYRLQTETKTPFIIFKYAYVGSSLHSDWNSRKPDTYFHSMIKNVRKMETALGTMGKTACYQGFIWSQGGADTGPRDVGDYADNLKNFIYDLRNSLGSPNLPFITARLKHPQEENHFHREQDKVAKEDQAFRIIETSDLSQDPDHIHFNAEGQITFGDRFYTAYLNLKDELAHGRPSKNLLVYPVPYLKTASDLYVKVQNNFYCSKVKLEFIDMLGQVVYISKDFEVLPEVDTTLEVPSSDLINLAEAPYIVSATLEQCSVVLQPKDKSIVKKIILL